MQAIVKIAKYGIRTIFAATWYFWFTVVPAKRGRIIFRKVRGGLLIHYSILLLQNTPTSNSAQVLISGIQLCCSSCKPLSICENAMLQFIAVDATGFNKNFFETGYL
jgi:hypothetical protein